MLILKNIVFLCGLLLFIACSNNPKSELSPAELLFQQAMNKLADKSYLDAKLKLEKLKSQYPWNPLAIHASLELINIYLKANEYSLALEIIREFEESYPNNDQMDYILYAKGLLFYSQNKSSIEDYIFTDISKRHNKHYKLAFDTFNSLISLYPNSIYAPDSRQRMLYLRNLFADKELDIAKFYLQKKAYAACINRAKVILTDFISSPVVPESLSILKECSRKSGVTALQNEASILLIQL